MRFFYYLVPLFFSFSIGLNLSSSQEKKEVVTLGKEVAHFVLPSINIDVARGVKEIKTTVTSLFFPHIQYTKILVALLLLGVTGFVQNCSFAGIFRYFAVLFLFFVVYLFSQQFSYPDVFVGPVGNPALVSRILSALHAILISICVIYSLFHYPFFSTEETGSFNDALTFFQSFSIVTRVYVFCDTLFVFFYSAESFLQNSLYLVHHVILFSCILFTGSDQVKYIIVGLLSEVVIPFLHLSWYLVKAGCRDSLLYKINGVFLFVFYLIFRVINFSWVLLSLFLNGSVAYWKLGGFSLIVLMNYYWFFLIAKKFVYAFWAFTSKKDKKLLVSS